MLKELYKWKYNQNTIDFYEFEILNVSKSSIDY